MHTTLVCATVCYTLATILAQDTLPPAATRVLASVRYLADDAREGRGVGTRGIEEAAHYIADAFAAAGAAPLTFVDAPAPKSAVGGSGYGAYLGTIPDMTGSPGGVLITGVRAGSPAQQAGLQAGDVITGIGAKTVANLFDMTDALRSQQSGDTVRITLKRGNQALAATAVLGKRGS